MMITLQKSCQYEHKDECPSQTSSVHVAEILERKSYPDGEAWRHPNNNIGLTPEKWNQP